MTTNAGRTEEWVAQLIHDLRSPVTALLASSELAQDPRSDKSDLVRANEVAHRSALRLIEIIDTMEPQAGGPDNK